ncbi:Nucleosomal histone H3-Lys79 methylase [Mortierella alpina]|uniref:Histone-lysine N-methyltransferase, H3 lysine-79 specific n=1 Tax=Mortierella alpina TaxID=64518 RepID=A0A9P6JC30_MORAP|nr:Nucleosomal histone H3-Lys79 methylase [Mortierella alpina]
MSMSTTTSPILRSAQLPQSPSKQGLSPLKKRHLEDISQAEASYSSPSSLSSLSPDRSNRTSYDRELGVSSVDPSTPAEAEAARHDFTSNGSPTDRLDKEPASQQSLELELFGSVLSNSSRASNGGDTNGRGSTNNGERTLPKSSNLRSSLESERKKRMGPQRSSKKTNGHSGRAQLPKGVREIVTINTIKGTVTTSIVKTPSPVKPNQGSVTQTVVPAVQANTIKDAAQKPVSASANGNGISSTRRMSILHSDQIVAAAMGRYKNHFHMIVEDSDSTVASSPSSTGADTMHVSLEYPGKDSKEKFTLMKPFLSRSKAESDDKDEYNPIEDLVQTVRIIMEYFFDPRQYRALFGSPTEGLYRSLTKYKNRKDGAQFLKAVEDFNVIMRKQKAQGTIQEYLKQYGHRLPYDLVVHLLQQVYSRTVAARASKLNQYEAFSNNVYGEILPILTKEFIQRTKLDQSKVFVDLGCGIGNVVLQVALQTGAESYGVEIMDTPAKFAKKQAKEFEARSRAFGLSHGSVTMLHGDFLDTPGLPAILAKADVVLVNNYAFNSALNQSLLQLFLDLKEGCKIISLKTFVSLDHKINVRNAGSVESILRVKKYPYYTNAVSWTHNGGEYYIATVDRTAVQAFWERAMAGGAAALDDGSSRRASSRRR